ncbi:hypothetical protein [Microbacterium sp. A94]|uniref:hypothetical protein n=1 Tax=Microbacterium sp. A94 TaxID=3450717 RepID=UPI003F6DFD5A
MCTEASTGDMIGRMLDESETAQLRSLQKRAYGRGGGLAAEDAARLHELESKLRPRVAAPSVVEPVERAAPVWGAEAVELSEVPDGSELPEESPSPEPEASAPSRRTRGRRRLALAAVGALLIGMGIGWTLWGWNTAEFALATTHSEKRAELEKSGDYDPGTVAALSESHGVVIWRAESQEGERTCIIVTTPVQKQSGCAELDQSNLGAANVSITVPEGDEAEGQMLNAFLLLSANGEVVPAIQLWNPEDNNWESQFSEEEREALDRVEAAGFDRNSLSILGYDGERPIWTSWGNEMCLIVESDAGIASGCSSTAEMPMTDLVVTAPVGGIPTQYIVHQTETRGQQLTIVRVPEGTRVEVTEGEQVEIDDKTGDIKE